MPTTIISLQQLLSSDMWKADSFVAAKTTRASSAFPMVPLSELVQERREFLDPTEYPEHSFCYIGLEHVASHTGDLVGFGPRKGKAVLSRSKVFRNGDILYGRLRAYLNKVFVANPPGEEGICSGEFYVLVPDVTRVHPVLLRALLASQFVREGVAGLHTGSALPRLQLDDLLRVALPVPPLPVQLEIVAGLERLTSERLRARRLLDDQPTLAEQELREALTEGRPFDPARAGATGDVEATVFGLPREHALVGGPRRAATMGLSFGG